MCISKWQALAFSDQNNDKMDVIAHWRGIFYKYGCSGKDYVEAFNFSVQITKNLKIVKEFKETVSYLFLLFFLWTFYLVLILPTTTSRSRGGEELQRQTNIQTKRNENKIQKKNENKAKQNDVQKNKSIMSIGPSLPK